MSGASGALFFAGVSICVWTLSRHTLVSVLAPLTVTYAAFADAHEGLCYLGVGHYVSVIGGCHTYGLVGFDGCLLTIGLLAAGRLRLGATVN